MKNKTVMKSVLGAEAAKHFLTSEEMAARIGVCKSSYHSLLRGSKRLTLQEANTINAEFGVPFEVLAAAELGTKLPYNQS